MRLLLTAVSALSMFQTVRRRSWLGKGDGEGDAEFVEVADLTRLDQLFAASSEGTVVLFLHDPYCPISARAHKRVSEAGGEINLIDVSRQHDLSDAVQSRTGVRHESPQALVLRDAKAVWYASHGGVTTQGLSTARDS